MLLCWFSKCSIRSHINTVTTYHKRDIEELLHCYTQKTDANTEGKSGKTRQELCNPSPQQIHISFSITLNKPENTLILSKTFQSNHNYDSASFVTLYCKKDRHDNDTSNKNSGLLFGPAIHMM